MRDWIPLITGMACCLVFLLGAIGWFIKQHEDAQDRRREDERRGIR